MTAVDDLPDEESGRFGPLVPRVKNQKAVERASGRAITAAIFAAVVFIYLIRSILFPFVISGVIAFVCTPLIDRMSDRTKMPRTAAAAIVFVAILAAIALFGILALPSLYDEIRHAVTDLQGTIQSAIEGVIGTGTAEVMGQRTNAAELTHQAMDGIRKAVLQADVLEMVVGGGVFAIFGTFLALVLLFYFLAGAPAIGRGLISLVPPRQRPMMRAIWAQLSPVLMRYFAGIGLVVVYASIAAYIGLGLFLHLRNATVLAIITGFAEIIPVVGPAFSALLAGFAAIGSSHGFGGIIGYIIYATLLRLSIDQFVGPLILGRAGRVHPTLIIFCFLTGGVLFNVVGVVLAIPVALTIKTVLATLYEEPLDMDDKGKPQGQSIPVTTGAGAA